MAVSSNYRTSWGFGVDGRCCLVAYGGLYASESTASKGPCRV